MKAGLSQEPVIIKEYIEEKAENGICVSVQECSFFVSPTDGFIGASPDGIVHEIIDNTESSGFSELKYFQTNDSESLRDALLRKRICVTSDNLILNHLDNFVALSLVRQMLQ